MLVIDCTFTVNEPKKSGAFRIYSFWVKSFGQSLDMSLVKELISRLLFEFVFPPLGNKILSKPTLVTSCLRLRPTNYILILLYNYVLWNKWLSISSTDAFFFLKFLVKIYNHFIWLQLVGIIFLSRDLVGTSNIIKRIEIM